MFLSLGPLKSCFQIKSAVQLGSWVRGELILPHFEVVNLKCAYVRSLSKTQVSVWACSILSGVQKFPF